MINLFIFCYRKSYFINNTKCKYFFIHFNHNFHYALYFQLSLYFLNINSKTFFTTCMLHWFWQHSTKNFNTIFISLTKNIIESSFFTLMQSFTTSFQSIAFFINIEHYKIPYRSLLRIGNVFASSIRIYGFYSTWNDHMDRWWFLYRDENVLISHFDSCQFRKIAFRMITYCGNWCVSEF